MAKLIYGVLVGLLLPLFAQPISAQEVPVTAPVVSPQPAADEPAASGSGLKELADIAGTNRIPLLDNRFRIDFAVDEITLVFFRKKGAPSVVLVRPDGSKIYAKTARDYQVEWHDDKTYDLIKMTKPTPGPWQAIGDILPESRIMVLTDIDLQVDPLPKDMMVGESLKVTAKLTNGGKLINAKDFRDILQLDVLLISTQKAEYDNSNSTVLELTSFADDGKNFDERPRDAIFTGEFKLDFQAGEWMPKYIVKTPLYTRELLQDPVVVVRTPLETSVEEGLTPDEKHILTYQITEGPIDPNTISLQGRIRYPSQEVQSFTIGEMAAANRTLAIANVGVGTYRVEQMMFGKTKSGREFMLSLPQITFAAVGPKIAVPELPAADATAAEQAAVTDPIADKTAATEVVAAESVAPFPLAWVIFGNVLILIVGGGAIFFAMNQNAKQMLSMLFAKLNPAALLKRKKGEAIDIADLPQEMSPTSADEMKKPAKKKASDDILDLSLPDD